jgi:hypothetical protein
MFDLPETTVDNFQCFADWVELCALASSDGSISQAVVADVAKDSGLVALLSDDLFPNDITFDDADTFSPEDIAQRFSESVWEHLRSRADALHENYPFLVESDRLVRTRLWTDVPGYTFLLLADISRSYAATVDIEPGSSFQYLFEKVVEAAGVGLGRGSSVRFGWPREKRWPKPIDKRIRRFALAMNLPMENLRGKTRPNDKDRGLDIAIRFGFADRGPATLILLTQCATGKHWKAKRGEPSIADWRDILQWQAPLLRAIAIPWRLPSRDEMIVAHRHFDDAVILDRPRLAAGAPDIQIAGAVKASLVRWCRSQFKKLPTITPLP